MVRRREQWCRGTIDRVVVGGNAASGSHGGEKVVEVMDHFPARDQRKCVYDASGTAGNVNSCGSGQIYISPSSIVVNEL